MEDDWLFTRGSQSVRLVRDEHPGGGLHLLVYGPGHEVVTYAFADVVTCMRRQAEIEQDLLATGYQLARVCSDRRGEHFTPSGEDDRRAAS